MEYQFQQGRQLINCSKRLKPLSQFEETATTLKRTITRSNTALTNSSLLKGKLRRMNSIEDNIQSLFKEHSQKWQSLLNIGQKEYKHINSINIQKLDTYEIIQDGLYIMIQGLVKIITFQEQAPPYRCVSKQITNNVFRKLRINKQMGVRNKDIPTNDLIKKISDKGQTNYNVSTINKPFSIFESVNQNCMSYSSDTILYRIDEQDIKLFEYKQKKQRIKTLLTMNQHLIKNHSMLHHTIQLKIYSFRNYIEVENVSIINKGSIKVLKNSIFSPKYNNQNIAYKKKICQLGQGSLLIKGYIYEVTSSTVQLLQIELNDTFQYIKNPQWMLNYEQSFANKQRLSHHSNHKKQNGKKKLKINFAQIQTPQISSLNTSQLSSERCIENDKNMHRNTKSLYDKQNFKLTEENLQDLKQNCLISDQKGRVHKYNYDKTIKQKVQNSIKIADAIVNIECKRSNTILFNSNTMKSKQKLFYKAMSPYIIISQKVGVKEMIQTIKALKSKENSFGVKKNQQKREKIKKLSKLKYLIDNQKPKTMYKSEVNSLHRLESFLSKKNKQNFENQKKKKIFDIKTRYGHKKSSSQVQSKTASVFYPRSTFNSSIKSNFTKHESQQTWKQKGDAQKMGKLTFYA